MQKIVNLVHVVVKMICDDVILSTAGVCEWLTCCGVTDVKPQRAFLVRNYTSPHLLMKDGNSNNCFWQVAAKTSCKPHNCSSSIYPSWCLVVSAAPARTFPNDFSSSFMSINQQAVLWQARSFLAIHSSFWHKWLTGTNIPGVLTEILPLITCGAYNCL